MTRARHDLLGDSTGSRTSTSEKGSKKGGGADKPQKVKLVVAVAVLVIATALIAYQVLPNFEPAKPELTEAELNQPPDMTGTIPTAPVPADTPRGRGVGTRPSN